MSYDSRNNNTIISYSGEEDSHRIEYSYDSQDRVETIEKYNSSKEIIERKYFEYNDHNNVIKEIRTETEWRSEKYSNSYGWYRAKDESSLTYKYEYKYDEQSNWTKKIEYHDDMPVYLYLREIEYYLGVLSLSGNNDSPEQMGISCYITSDIVYLPDFLPAKRKTGVVHRKNNFTLFL